MNLKEKKISSKEVYNCPFLDIYEDKVLLPNGKESYRIYIKHIGAAAVLPITSENKIILVKQFRYPVNAVTFEIPAGKFDFLNEDPLLCIKRELEEETGYNSNNVKHIIDIHSAIAYSSELISMFIAYDCYKVENPISSEDEFVEVVELTLQEVMKLLKTKEITDAKTILAIQNYLLHKDD